MPKTTRNIESYLPVLARVLMSSLFLWDGILQLWHPAGTGEYFARLGIPMPDVAVWVSIPIHILGGLAILVGYETRWAAGLLVLLCLGTAFGVHLPAGDPENTLNFFKNLVMAGGFLYVMAFGAGAISLDEGVAAGGPQTRRSTAVQSNGVSRSKNAPPNKVVLPRAAKPVIAPNYEADCSQLRPPLN
jgi:putative oxidoreductase